MIKCACNNRKCDGECRDVNLHRPRTVVLGTPQNRCPSAFGSDTKQSEKQFGTRLKVR